jgi:hypothetical protein
MTSLSSCWFQRGSTNCLYHTACQEQNQSSDLGCLGPTNRVLFTITHWLEMCTTVVRVSGQGKHIPALPPAGHSSLWLRSSPQDPSALLDLRELQPTGCAWPLSTTEPPPQPTFSKTVPCLVPRVPKLGKNDIECS